MCSNTTLALSALPNVKARAGGDLHSLVATADGTVYAWGDNSSGQLGVTTQQTCYGQPCSPVPVQVTGMPAVSAVAAGQYHSLALTTTGAVYAWGGNYDGALGIGTTNNTASPTPVTGLPANVTAIAAGGDDSLALTADGLVYAWGSNSSGQLGVATSTMCGTTPCSTDAQRGKRACPSGHLRIDRHTTEGEGDLALRFPAYRVYGKLPATRGPAAPAPAARSRPSDRTPSPPGRCRARPARLPRE